MAYVRYKEVTKHFNFTREIELKDIPSYILDYVYDDEVLLAGYKVGRDHGIVTTKKIVLFDNTISLKPKKEITVIPYRSVTAHSVVFYSTSAKVYLLLESGYPVLLKFSNMDTEDKVRLRLLYNAMSAAICGQTVPTKIVKKIINSDFEIKKDKED